MPNWNPNPMPKRPPWSSRWRYLTTGHSDYWHNTAWWRKRILRRQYRRYLRRSGGTTLPHRMGDR